jgi:hypothetical protein
MGKKTGFARMSPERRREAGRSGGKAAARSKKRPHRFTPEEAARAAKIGHKKTPGSRNPRGRRPSKHPRGYIWQWDEKLEEWVLVEKKKGSGS